MHRSRIRRIARGAARSSSPARVRKTEGAALEPPAGAPPEAPLGGGAWRGRPGGWPAGSSPAPVLYAPVNECGRPTTVVVHGTTTTDTAA